MKQTAVEATPSVSPVFDSGKIAFQEGQCWNENG